MKLEDFAYRVALKTLQLLEHHYHYKIPEEHKKELVKEVCANLTPLIHGEEKKA